MKIAFTFDEKVLSAKPDNGEQVFCWQRHNKERDHATLIKTTQLMFIVICEHLWQIMFPLSSIFFLLYAAESSCKSSCRVLPQVFSSPLSLVKSNAGKSSCTSVPLSIHLFARQTWKETFSDSLKKEKQCWEPPMWTMEIMNHLFCRFSKRGKFL